MDTEKIHTSQFLILVSLFTLGSAIIYIPHIIIKHARQDAWLVSLLALAFGLITIMVYLKTHKMFPNYNFIEILEHTFGKIAGKVIGLFIIMSFHFIILVMTLRDFGDFIVVHILAETPLKVIVFIFLVLIAYAVKHGLEVVTRTAQILFPIALFFFLLSAVLLLNKSDIRNLLPFMSEGWKPVIRAAIPNIGFPFLEWFVLVIILPYVTPKRKVAKSLTLGVLVGGMMIAIAVFYSLVVLGVEYSSSKIYIPYLLGAEINIANVIQRVEVIIADIWIISIFIKLCVLLLTTVIGLQQIFNLADYRLLVLPIALLSIPFTVLVMPNMSYWGVIEDVWPFWASIHAIFLPLLILLINTIKNKAAKKGG